MGASQSAHEPEELASDEEEEEEDDDGEGEEGLTGDSRANAAGTENSLVKKLLEQEPEMLPCYASASPLSPQLSSLGTPRLGPSIKVWDPYNVLGPPPPPPPVPVFSRSYSMASAGGGSGDDDHRAVTEVVLVSHGECELNLRPDLVGGRCHMAGLSPIGKRQARALAVFLNSQGVRFNAVYSSPLDRARSMAALVCQEMSFGKEQIQTSDELSEMSMGLWEGCSHAEIYTPEVLSLVESSQPDFCAPSGESLRQVEFRMVQFLNGTIARLPEKLRTDLSMHHQNDNQGGGFAHDRDGQSLPSPHWHHHRPGLTRKKSGKSRLQFVTSTGNQEGDGDEISPSETNQRSSVTDGLSIPGSSPSSSVSWCVGVFTHSVPIKCLLTGLLGCSPVMSHKICIEDSSVTVLQHSLRTGWQIKRLNDTAHLRLL
ncbi:Broad-specificity phosphatase YOR283W [Linum grandiflorum]